MRVKSNKNVAATAKKMGEILDIPSLGDPQLVKRMNGVFNCAVLAFFVPVSKIKVWNEAMKAKTGSELFVFVDYFVTPEMDCAHMHKEVVTTNPFAAKTTVLHERAIAGGQIFELVDDFATTKFFNSMLSLVTFILSPVGRKFGWYISETDLARSSEFMMVYTTERKNSTVESYALMQKLKGGKEFLHPAIDRHQWHPARPRHDRIWKAAC